MFFVVEGEATEPVLVSTQFGGRDYSILGGPTWHQFRRRRLSHFFDYFGAWAEECQVGLEIIGEQVCILGDRLMVRRALSNLLSNAIRYTPVGNAVSVTLQAGANAETVRVENPGPIIPGEHIDRIFERFYRTDASRQRSGEGAGLGLAIARSIVEAHGGTVHARSTVQATTFEINLPSIHC